MDCCPQCFGDTFLTQQIMNKSILKGNCDYCNSTDVPLVEPIYLQDLFELLLGIYKEDQQGKSLIELLKYDWNLFESLDNAHSKELLADIFDDGQIVRKMYNPVNADDSSSLEQWIAFRQELKHENRYFPKNAPDIELLGSLLQMLASDMNSIPEILFRARIADGSKKLTATEMGKPPKEKSSNGRANPTGIPYLYLASDIQTAIAEIRPYTGDTVCIAEFKVLKKPSVIDLQNPRKTISPFALSDELSIINLRNEIGFLCQLGEELTRPVLPGYAHLEYLPSQYLCEFIKHLGFDGVMYRSSTGNGVNFALFNDEFVMIDNIKAYIVNHIDINTTLA